MLTTTICSTKENVNVEIYVSVFGVKKSCVVLDCLHKFRVNLHFLFMCLRNSRVDSAVLFWFINLSVCEPVLTKSTSKSTLAIPII
jgi:hypothetical protein